MAAASRVGGAVEGLITGYHPIDIAFAMEQLEPDERKLVFELLKAHQAGVVLEEIDNEIEQELVEETEDEELAEIIDAMPPDVGADVVGRMDDQQAQRVLELMPDEESDEIEELLEYPEESAGGLMTTEFISVPEGFTAEQAVQHLRDTEVNPEGVAYVYVLEEDGVLVGVADVRVVVTEPPTARIADFMITDLITVPPEADRHEVVELADKYDLLAVPVVTEDGRLLGAVTHDDVVDAIGEEHTEDVLRMAGTGPRDLLAKSPLSAALVRLPWLSLSLIGGLGAAAIMDQFAKRGTEAATDAAAGMDPKLILLAFAPAIMAMGGASGLQSATIVVRSLALGTIRTYGTWKLFARELLTATVLGTICGGVAGIVGWWQSGEPQIGVVVGLGMFAAMAWAASVGTFAPIVFERIGADPALASGPLTTMANDLFSLAIYFALALALAQSLLAPPHIPG